MEHTPVALFAWQRPQHTLRCLEALAANELALQSDLFIFIDGPRNERESRLVEEVHDVAASVTGFRSVSIHRSPVNIGLSQSITGGVSRVLQDFDAVIVVEDDIVVSRSFLQYMNDFLELYADDPEVACIHGYVYPHEHDLSPTFFITGADCWGWATWRRAWAKYRPDGSVLLAELFERDLVAQFDFDGSAGYVDMLRDQIDGRNDSWAVRWYASTLLEGMLTLYPNRPLAMNVGNDGSGSHGGFSRAFDVELSHDPIQPVRIPIQESEIGRLAFVEFFTAEQDASRQVGVRRTMKWALRPLWSRLTPSTRYWIGSRLRP